ncbi:MOSC N-terminal beta barrel domain-containing protein [Salibacteraceae bacterium]|nr:MOSC N-terminal beta barrel domain-containing protein [Salibacteraceae bacterium]
MAHVSDIRIYPIKSLDPIILDACEIGHHSLKHDRAFAIMTDDGKYVNGKRTGRVNQLEAKFDLKNGTVRLGDRFVDDSEIFELNISNKRMVEFLCDFFNLKVKLVKSEEGSLLDEPKNSSATIVSTSTYLSIQKSFPHLTLDEIRLRFRSNIEIAGVDAFWEEQFVGSPGEKIHFRIGEVEFSGTGPRARCNVPPRNPNSGDPDSGFAKQFVKSRKASLPDKSILPEYGHLYYLTIDAYIGLNQIGKKIYVQDQVEDCSGK